MVSKQRCACVVHCSRVVLIFRYARTHIHTHWQAGRQADRQPETNRRTASLSSLFHMVRRCASNANVIMWCHSARLCSQHFSLGSQKFNTLEVKLEFRCIQITLCLGDARSIMLILELVLHLSLYADSWGRPLHHQSVTDDATALWQFCGCMRHSELMEMMQMSETKFSSEVSAAVLRLVIGADLIWRPRSPRRHIRQMATLPQLRQLPDRFVALQSNT